MSFTDLYKSAVKSLSVSWLASTNPTDTLNELSLELSTDVSQKMNKFVEENPEHPVANVHKIVPDWVNLQLKMANDDLWKHYLELRKTKKDADDDFYEKMDKVISATKTLMEHSNVSHPIQLNENGFATPEQILSIVEKMANICRSTIESNNQNETIPVKKFTRKDIDKLMIPYRSEVGYLIGTNNGSFMTPIDVGFSNIHVFDSKNNNDIFGSFAHEIGHALYQTRFLNKYTEIGKLGGMLSLSLHESSSIFHEMMLYGVDYNIEPKNKNNMRRLTADRLNYILHIYIRTKIEHEIFANNLTAREIPQLWNKLMKEYIGLTPSNDWEGFLQDVHWPSGAFGYFHSYAIGMLNAIDMMQSPTVNSRMNNIKDKNNYHEIIENVILPEIDSRYGKFNEFSTDMFETMYFGCMNSLVDRFESFVKENFNIVI